MMWLNLIFILILLFNCIRGYGQGLILQVTSILRTVLSIVIAYQLSSDIVPVLQQKIPISQQGIPVDLVYKGLAFLILLIGSRLALSFLFGFINQIFHLPVLSFVNRLGGLLFGVLQTAIISIITVNLLYISPWEVGREAVQESSYAQVILDTLPSLKKTPSA
jgi:membrane protein required for colicin V production